MATASSQKIVAIHQPNYFPWLGYFHKIWVSDVFVLHDIVEHSKRYPTRRTRVRKAATDCSPVWLTVPLSKHSDYTLIKDLEIDHKQAWPEKHLRMLKNIYQHAPFYSITIEKIENWLAIAHLFPLLSEWNIYLIKAIMENLDISRYTIRSSALSVQEKGSKGNVEIVGTLGGTVYLSGIGGANYQSDIEFQAKGIELRQSRFIENFKENMSDYPFGLSVLDAFFYLDEDTIKKLLRGC